MVTISKYGSPATGLSMLDAAYFGGSEQEAELRTRLTLIGISTAYGASLIYGSTFKSNVLRNYRKDLLKASASTTKIVGVEAIKRKNE